MQKPRDETRLLNLKTCSVAGPPGEGIWGRRYGLRGRTVNSVKESEACSQTPRGPF